MEILNAVNHQYVFFLPVGLVLLCAGLVFAFGFKSSVEPPNFKQLSFSTDERKQGLKKKKPKEKKSQSNGHATVLIEDNETKKSEAKPLKQSNKVEAVKNKKPEEAEKVKEKNVQKSPTKSEKKKASGKENQGKNKHSEVKPEDFDDGTWETAVSRKEKKNRKKDEDVIGLITPEKTPKKKVESPGKKAKKEEKVVEEIKQTEVVEVKPDPKPVEEKIAEEKPVEVAEEEKVSDDSTGKKKKNKKAKPVEKIEEKVPVVEKLPETTKKIEVKKEVVEKVVEVKPVESKVEEKSAEAPPASSGGAVFDELGDVWKEAPQKKSKKKVRKE